MEPLKAGDPRTVGPYVLIARLGSGGMGQVFLGRTRGGRTVAVKVVKAELAQDREFRRRFRQEVAAARLVSGRYTAAVVDADPEAVTPWLATAYVSGLTLRAVVGAGALLPETSLRVLAYGLARALAEIHSAGVVHRDLKPSNVMLAVDGPHVIDFGISRVMAASDFTRTDVGTIIGSPGFMSPEQTQGQALTTATDVFSLGTVLAYAATGRNPFGDGPDHALLYRIAHGGPDLTGVPDSLAPLIARCLDKDPAQRPSTAQIIGRMADTPGGGAWLPADLTAAIAQSAAEILDYEGIAVFPQPDVDPVTAPLPGPPGPGPNPTLVLRTSADQPTSVLETTGERAQERVGVGGPPEGKRGAGGAGIVAGLLSVAVIAALATALVLVLNNGSHSPGTPPAASVGTSTSPSPLTRSVSPTPSSQSDATTPTPTTSSSPTPTTPSSTSKSTSTPSTPTSTSASTTPSSSPSSVPSSSPSSSPPPTSSPSTTHSSAPSPTPSPAHSSG